MAHHDVRSAPPRSAGQVLVLFALTITVLLGSAGLAFDIGRFHGAADPRHVSAANPEQEGAKR